MKFLKSTTVLVLISFVLIAVAGCGVSKNKYETLLNEKMALVALGFYVLEATLLAVSRIQAFSLIGISQEYVATGQPTALKVQGNLMIESMDFAGKTLTIVAPISQA